ncbi:hypothetical protein HZA96_04260 [Candidatus Woesearchaeota archaeon]|nr:hypothetical protein [Candidatus Woesearchaeota archaeon]
MVKRHIKRLTAPVTWNLKRNDGKYIVCPFPSGHKQALSLPLLLLLRDVMKVGRTSAEVREILHTQKVTVDNKRVDELKYGVGLFDVVGIEALKKYYRVVLANDGVLTAVEIPETEKAIKPLMVVAKNMIAKGKLQITLLDGTCALLQQKDDINKTICAGDTVVYNYVDKKISDVFKCDVGNYVCIIDGRNIGAYGAIESIADNTLVLVTPENKKIQTLKSYALLVGKKQPVVTAHK